MGSYVLRGRVPVDDVVRFAKVGEDRHKGVIHVEYQPVIDIVINPCLDGVSDIGEVDDHTSFVESVSLYVNLDASVVSVQVSALTVIVKESVAVAEVDDARYGVVCQGVGTGCYSSNISDM